MPTNTDAAIVDSYIDTMARLHVQANHLAAQVFTVRDVAMYRVQAEQLAALAATLLEVTGAAVHQVRA